MLSTCNRIEVYAVVDAFHGGLADVSERARPARRAAAGRADRAPLRALRGLGGPAPVRRRRRPGLDGDRRGADPRPAARGLRRRRRGRARSGATLHELSQQALRVGKRVHAGTGIDAAGASVVSEALAAAAQALGGRTGLAGLRAVVVGAGAMGALAAAHLRRAGAAEIVVLNRSAERAERLAENTRRTGTPARAASAGRAGRRAGRGGRGRRLHRRGRHRRRPRRPSWPRWRPAAAARWSSATSGCPATSTRRSPRCPASRSSTWSRCSAGSRRRAPRRGRRRARQELVADEAQAYLAAQRSAEVTPDRHRAAPPRVRGRRRRAAAAGLPAARPRPDDVRDEFTRTVRRVVDKLLHTPTVQVKRLAEGPDGASYAARAARAVRARPADARRGRRAAQRRRPRRAGGPSRRAPQVRERRSPAFRDIAATTPSRSRRGA